MIILGLSGPAGCGKDTIADFLVERYGYVKFAFSDALYQEVQEAFGLEDQELLRNRETKEVPTTRLALKNCTGEEFSEIMVAWLDRECTNGGYDKLLYPWGAPLSPREVLQVWGTEFRRASDPDYWIKKAEQFIRMTQEMYPEQRPQYFVNPTVRFKNEREWIIDWTVRDLGSLEWFGNVWHVRRDSLRLVNPHASETPLPVLPGERELWNNSTIENLYKGIDLLMSTSAPVVRCEPMEEDVRPRYEEQPDGTITPVEPEEAKQ